MAIDKNLCLRKLKNYIHYIAGTIAVKKKTSCLALSIN
jgi:hypothetical protein